MTTTSPIPDAEKQEESGPGTELADPTNEALRVAQAKTILLFELFLSPYVHTPPPVHSASGLPKAESCNGYAALFHVFWPQGFTAPSAIYACIVAAERGLDPAVAVQAFIDAAREPAHRAEALAAKTATQRLFADYQKRGLTPGVPLRADNLPDPRWQMAYAAMARALEGTPENAP